ncbi:MAG: zinc ribbon domain-containing protein [Acidobacteriota bacterium]|nr:zinc ribbon domain-containing protein [Acidobacteriota bacterium]
MPIYEYRCESCGDKFEKLVRRASEAVEAGPSCGEKHLEQQYSTFAARGGSSGNDSFTPAQTRGEGGGCGGGMCGAPGMCGRN